MAKKKESEKKKEIPKKKENEKKIVNKQSNKNVHRYSLEELADIFGVTVLQMRTMYKIRGFNKDDKFSYEEALEKIANK